MISVLIFLFCFQAQSIKHNRLDVKENAVFLADTDESILTNSNGLINYTCDSVDYIIWEKHNVRGGKCVVDADADHGSFTRNNGDTIRLNFIGTKVHILAWKQENSGLVNVRIDNNIVGNPSFNSGRTERYRLPGIVFTSDDLPFGPHTIEIEHNDTTDLRSMVFASFYVDPLPKNGGHKLGFDNFGEREGTWTLNSQSTIPSFSCDEDTCSGAFSFYGSRFWLTGVRSSTEGNLKVIIDKQETIVTKSVTSGIAQGNAGVLLYSSDNLGLGFHTVKVQRTNQKITLNNFYYAETEEGTAATSPVNTTVLTNPSGLINLTCDKFEYQGWEDGGRGGICVKDGQADHGSFTRNTNAKATLQFTGSRFHILAWKQENSGNAKIIIDGKLASITNFNSGGGRLPGMAFTSNILPYGHHTLEIVHNDTYNARSVVFAGVYVDPLPYYGGYSLGLEGVTKRRGDWSINSQTTPPTFGCSSENCAGTFTFIGTKFWLTGLRSSTVGCLGLIIDAGRMIYVYTNTTAGIAQNNIPILLYESEDLDFLEHNIKIYNVGPEIKLTNFFYTIFPYAKLPEKPPTLPPPASTPSETIPEVEPIDESTELTTDGRYERIVEDYSAFRAEIKSTRFTGVFSEDRGGAIHVVNIGLKVENTDFSNCESKTGGGGGIYIRNTYNYANEIYLAYVNLEDCKAQYGGGIYLYSDVDPERVRPYLAEVKCTRTTASATKEAPAADGLYGGSGIYISTKLAVMTNLHFDGCTGNAVYLSRTKIVSRSMILDTKPFVISDCTFVMNQQTTCALNCVLDDSSSPIEVKQCTFKGQLINGQKYIDGQVKGKSSAKIIVKKCRFSSSAEQILSGKSDLISIDLNDQIFNYNDENAFKISNNTWKILAAVLVPAVVAVAAIVLIVIIKKRKNPNNAEKDQVIDESDATKSMDKTLNAHLL